MFSSILFPISWETFVSLIRVILRACVHGSEGPHVDKVTRFKVG